MAFNKYYSGSFVSRKNHIIKVDILKDAAAPASVGELSFPADSPLTVEWSADSKMETIHGSTATLTVISPGDRTYIDMYTAEVGSVRMDVYRDNALWWRGTLDTEFYEEPFISNQDYDVVMTFSDFGTLERLKYNIGIDVPTLHAIVGNALGRLQLGTTYELMTSTGLSAGTTMVLSDISIRSDNFTDEDGEVSNMEDVIKGILEPLGLHMRQWAGKVYIYDDNALSKTTSERITWDSDDQTLGVDEVANSATVTFSPYAEAEIFKKETFKAGFTPDRGLTNLTTAKSTATDAKGNTYTYNTWYEDNLNDSKVSGNWDYNYIGINFYTCDSASPSGMTVGNTLKPCHFESFGNGDTCDALYRYVRLNTHVNASVGGYGTRMGWPSSLSHDTLFSVPRFYCPAKPATGQYYLQLTQPLLLSAAYNPFGSESQGESGNCEKLTKRAGYVMIPFRARLYDDSGTVIKHYRNYDISTSAPATLGISKGTWDDGDYDNTSGASSSAFLSWYSLEDRKTSNGIDGGWKKNRQFIGISKKDSFPSFKDLDEGQYMELPPVAGRIGIEIEGEVLIYDWGNSGSTDTELLGPVVQTTKDLYGTITWHCYQQPTIKLVSYINGKVEEVEVDDIEYKGTLLASAKDDMSVDTICGTATLQLLGARGQYIKASDGSQITVMYREGRGTTAEQLLIGTLHSHYATRHAKLSGTCRLSNDTGLTVFDDEVLQLPMVMTSATADLIADECECTLIETNSDNYEDI